jgi:hypothetical protein
MEHLKELNSSELINLNGGIVWVPILIKGAKLVGGGAAAYLGHEIIDGVVRGIAGGDYVDCN